MLPAQRSTSRVRIRNQIFLKRPWLFPIFSVIGGCIGLFNRPKELSNTAVMSIFLVVIIVINTWFFISLWRTTRERKPPES
jgi:uncharacterized membrane protein AbrB (regulator of aidB expression)